MTYFINKFIHSYKLDYTAFFNQNMGLIQEEYEREFENRKKTRPDLPLTDITLSNPTLLNFITPKLEKIVSDFYYTGPKLEEAGIRVYKQISDDYVTALHSHVHIMTTINAVFYLNIPKEGGEIFFSYMNGKYSEGRGMEVTLKPQMDMVYFFPSWLPHTPLPHKDKNVTRLCFNWGWHSEYKARHKATGIVW